MTLKQSKTAQQSPFAYALLRYRTSIEPSVPGAFLASLETVPENTLKAQ